MRASYAPALQACLACLTLGCGGNLPSYVAVPDYMRVEVNGVAWTLQSARAQFDGTRWTLFVEHDAPDSGKVYLLKAWVDPFGGASTYDIPTANGSEAALIQVGDTSSEGPSPSAYLAQIANSGRLSITRYEANHGAANGTLDIDLHGNDTAGSVLHVVASFRLTVAH